MTRAVIFKAALRLLCGCAVLAVLFAVIVSLEWLMRQSLPAFLVLAGCVLAWVFGGCVQIVIRKEHDQ